MIGPRSVLTFGALLAVSLAVAEESNGLRGSLTADDVPIIPPARATPPAAPTTDAVVTGGVPEKPSTNPATVKAKPVAERLTPLTAVDTSDGRKGIITGADLRRTVEDDPFAPLGIRVGTFIYYPAVTFSAGYTSNAAAAAGGSAAPLLGIAPEAVLKSDWARHAATFAMRAADVTYPGNSAPDLPTAEILATGRLDLADRWNVGLEGGYNYSTQSVSDPDFPTAAVTPPAVHDGHAVIALKGGAGPGVFTVAGKAERTVYDNAVSASGKTIDQSDRDNNQFNGRLRLGYAVTPVVTPFIEGELSEQLFDQRIDDNGIARSGHGAVLRAGLAFNDAPVLTGEIALGAGRVSFDDKSLATLHALTVDGSLVWSPTALVSLTTNLATSFDPATDPASSGAVVYDATVDLAYAYRRNLTLDWTAGLHSEQFQGTGETDLTYRLGIGAVWKINRNLQLASGYVHEWLDSNAAGRDYVSDTLSVDLRMLR